MAARVHDITKVKRPGRESWPLMARYPPPGIWPKLFDYGSTLNPAQLLDIRDTAVASRSLRRTIVRLEEAADGAIREARGHAVGEAARPELAERPRRTVALDLEVVGAERIRGVHVGQYPTFPDAGRGQRRLAPHG